MKVLFRLKEEQGIATSVKTYQSVEIVRDDQGLALLKSKYHTYIDSVLACLHDQLKIRDSSEDVATLTHALKILATHGWGKN